MSIPQFFGVVPTGCPVITSPTSAISDTSLLYSLPSNRTFNHIVVFLLPGVELPPNTAAAVYLSFAQPNAGTQSDFKFLGGIGPGKESAIFKVFAADVQSQLGQKEMLLGISIEPAEQVAAQMASTNGAVVPAAKSQPNQTVLLAQRIIKNAFNFLASFSGNVPVPGSSGTAGVEVVPLKAFQDWWTKFENRIRNDPSFLERDVD
jgi:hypothetical protein